MSSKGEGKTFNKCMKVYYKPNGKIPPKARFSITSNQAENKNLEGGFKLAFNI